MGASWFGANAGAKTFSLRTICPSSQPTKRAAYHEPGRTHESLSLFQG